MTKLENIYYRVVTKYDTAHKAKTIYNHFAHLKGPKHIWTIDTLNELSVNPHKDKLRDVPCDFTLENIIVIEIVEN